MRRGPGTRYVTGAALGYDAEVEPVTMRCSCGVVQTETLASDAPLKAQLAGVTCLFCGAMGQMKRAS